MSGGGGRTERAQRGGGWGSISLTRFARPRARRALSFKLRAQSCGLTTSSGEVSRIIMTGGGANSATMLQTFADVFDCPVFVPESVSDGAALGAAVRAAHGAFNADSPRTRQVSFEALCGDMLRSSMRQVAVADGAAAEVYTSLIAGYDDYECDVQYKSAEWAAERDQRELERKAEEKMAAKSKSKQAKKDADSENNNTHLLLVGLVLGVIISASVVRWGFKR